MFCLITEHIRIVLESGKGQLLREEADYWGDNRVDLLEIRFVAKLPKRSRVEGLNYRGKTKTGASLKN